MTITPTTAQTPRMQSPASTIAPRIAGSRGSPSRHASPMLTFWPSTPRPITTVSRPVRTSSMMTASTTMASTDGSTIANTSNSRCRTCACVMSCPAPMFSWPTTSRRSSENAVDATP